MNRLKPGLYKIVKDKSKNNILGLTSEFAISNVKLPFEINGYKIRFITKFDETKHEVIDVLEIPTDLNMQAFLIRDKNTNNYGLLFDKPTCLEIPFGIVLDGKQYVVTFIKYNKDRIDTNRYEVIKQILL